MSIISLFKKSSIVIETSIVYSNSACGLKLMAAASQFTVLKQ
jgi:hypothetical protein